MNIDFDEDSPRQILSGIEEYYQPDEFIGKKVCTILNLPPRKIRDVLSYGMVLTAKNKKKIVLLDPSQETVIGTKIY